MEWVCFSSCWVTSFQLKWRPQHDLQPPGTEHGKVRCTSQHFLRLAAQACARVYSLEAEIRSEPATLPPHLF